MSFQIRKFDFVELFNKIFIAFITKATTEISEIFSKHFCDIRKSKIKISYCIFKSGSGAKKSADSDLAKRLNINTS